MLNLRFEGCLLPQRHAAFCVHCNECLGHSLVIYGLQDIASIFWTICPNDVLQELACGWQTGDFSPKHLDMSDRNATGYIGTRPKTKVQFVICRVIPFGRLLWDLGPQERFGNPYEVSPYGGYAPEL